MNIICSHGFRMLLSKMKEFKMDLGRSYTTKDDKGHLQPDIKDSFVLGFKKENYGFLYKVGVLGPISLYTYSYLPDNQIWLFKEGSIQKEVIEYDHNEAKLNIEKYLAELIMKYNN
jgi:hypothetical protein